MPNDDNQKNTKPQSDVNAPLPPVFMTEEVTPPMDIQNPSPADSATPAPTTTKTPVAQAGSAAPTDDIVQPVITSSQPKKKFAGGKGKIIATILGIFLLVGGVGAGIVLVNQQQDVRERADDPLPPDDDPYRLPECVSCEKDSDGRLITGEEYPTNETRPWIAEGYLPEEVNNLNAATGSDVAGAWCGGRCIQEPDSEYAGYYSWNGRYYPIDTTPPVTEGGTDRGVIGCPPGMISVMSNPPVYFPRPNKPDNYCLYSTSGNCVPPSASNNWHGGCMVGGNYDCGPGQGYCQECWCETPTTPTPPATATPVPNAMCQDVKAYDTNWIQLTGTQLSQLVPDDIVRFCVLGSASSGTFDMARFTINGVLRPETTLRRPVSGVDSDDFCEVYTIPEGISSFTVTAQIHHVSLGWK